MNFLIIFGAKYLYLVIVIAALWYVSTQPKEQRFRIILAACFALPLTYVVAKLMSSFYYDPRPFVVGNFTPLLPHAPDNGFPSDHTLLSAAVAAVVFFFHRKLGIALFAVAFLVGMARVVAGIHHFIDILGSIIIAFLVTAFFMKYLLAPLYRYFAPFFLKDVTVDK